MISTWANKDGEWKEKDYSTFSELGEMDFLMSSESSLHDFINRVNELLK
jgi:hypothetical protein